MPGRRAGGAGRHHRRAVRPDPRAWPTRSCGPRVAAAEQRRHVPARGVRDARPGRTARPALSGGARRRRPALRDLPAGRRGTRDRLAGGRARRQRAHPDLLSRWPRPARASSRSAGCPACWAATSSAPTACPSRGSGSDAAALATRAVADGDEFVVDGVKAWITHGGEADFYTLFARTSGDRAGRTGPAASAASTSPPRRPGVSAAPPEHKMGMRGSPTAQVRFDVAPGCPPGS